METWSEVLDSCPGLLCCVVTLQGRLMYATHGYKAAAARLFGHRCEEGRNYPPRISEVDNAMHEALTAACLGKANAMEVSTHDNIWELSMSPLKVQGKITGAVIRIALNSAKNLPPVIQSNPDLLNAVPFRACVTDDKGIILASNKFFSASLGVMPDGANIAQIADPLTHSQLMNILVQRSGNVECFMNDSTPGQNFFDVAPEDVYLDENSKAAEKNPQTLRRFMIHVSPLEWNGHNASLLTFEDITQTARAQEQVRRLLTFDDTTGLLNKRGFLHLLRGEFAQAARNSQHLSIIAVGLDGLGTLSESLGCSAAEKVIRRFVFALRKFIDGRAESSVAVWGRGEFMILAHCPGAVAVVLANEIRDRADNLKVSAGVTDLAVKGFAGVDEFIGAAYDALVQARVDGGNVTVLAGRE